MRKIKLIEFFDHTNTYECRECYYGSDYTLSIGIGSEDWSEITDEEYENLKELVYIHNENINKGRRNYFDLGRLIIITDRDTSIPKLISSYKRVLSEEKALILKKEKEKLEKERIRKEKLEKRKRKAEETRISNYKKKIEEFEKTSEVVEN